MYDEAGNHGFIGDPNGNVISFDAPGATSAYGTIGEAINDKQVSTGYFAGDNNVYHSFIRNKRGKITTFDVPGAGGSPGSGSVALCINVKGATAGYYLDSGFVYRQSHTRCRRCVHEHRHQRCGRGRDHQGTRVSKHQRRSAQRQASAYPIQTQVRMAISARPPAASRKSMLRVRDRRLSGHDHPQHKQEAYDDWCVYRFQRRRSLATSSHLMAGSKNST